MKKLIRFSIIFFVGLQIPLTIKAQTKFIGVGVNYNSVRAYTGYDVTTNQYKQKLSILNMGISWSKYSSVRRGYNFNLFPVNKLKVKTTSETSPSSNKETSYNGFGVGLGFWGLIASDYQSKVELTLNTNGNLVFTNYVFGTWDFGMGGRYRINHNLKAGVEFYPLSIASGTTDGGDIYGGGLGMHLAFRVYYALN